MLDLLLPGVGGLEICRQLRHVVPSTTSLHMAVVNRGLNREPTARIVRDLSADPGKALTVDLQALFGRVMAINPTTEVYLLDPSGRILRHVALAGRITLNSVSIASIRQLLGPDTMLPLHGDEP